MTLTSKLVYESEISIVGTSGTYPNTDNCYVVDVTEKDGTKWTNHFAPKPVVDMAMFLKSPKVNLTKSQMADVISIFNAYGDWKYTEASDSAAMDQAESDI